MAFSTGSSVTWSDVQALYNNLNSVKTNKLGQSAVAVPSNPGLTLPAQVTALKNAIESCKSNSYINAAGTYNTGITVPSTGSLLYPGIFNTMSNTITKINDTCLHNSAHFTSNHGFGSFSNNGFGSFSINMFHSKASNSYGSFGPHNGF